MGFFSWKCNSCGRAIMAPYQLPASLGWMNDVVAILPDGTKREGSYDGYGRVDDESLPFDSAEPGLWHQRCYSEQGYEPSETSSMQGFYPWEQEAT